MSVFSTIYTEVLWRPLFNGLVWLYTSLPWQDFGLAVIILTVIIRLALSPLLIKSQKSQRELAALQPDIKAIQDKYKNNKEAQGKALMELYASRKVNPFSGCLVMAIQLPILLALFGVFRGVFDAAQFKYLYSFVTNPGVLNPSSFFGLIDLSRGNILLGAAAALSQYFQTKIAAPPTASVGGQDFNKMLRWQTLYIFPALILVWSRTLPSALTLYWTVLNIAGILQEIVMQKLWTRKG